MKHIQHEPRLRDFEAMLAGPGIDWGLMGPRERDRLWDRHILNCAVVAEDRELVPEGAHVVDVGTGAGLPGIVWALCREDIRVTLIESLLRRTDFLTEAVAGLGLAPRVQVMRARAEDVTGVAADVVTARAVAPLNKLLRWLRPLVRPGGQLVLLKGRTAAQEVAESADLARRLGLSSARVLQVGAGVVEPPTTVVAFSLLA